MTLMNAEPAEAILARTWPTARGVAGQSLLRAGIAFAAAGLLLVLICGLAYADASASLSVNIVPAGSPSGGSLAYQPPGCVPGNHGLVRGRPSITSIGGKPTLVADDGCLINSYDAFASQSGYGPGGVYENPSPYASTAYSTATMGVNLQWVQEVHAAGFNAVTSGPLVQTDTQTNCPLGFPFTQTLSQYVSTIQTLLSYANQVGVYLLIQPTQCDQWNTANNGPAGPFDQTFQNQIWTTLAQNFGGNTNVIFMENGEPEGYSNWSCGVETTMSNTDYLTIRANGGASTMFMAFSDFPFSDNGGNPVSNCGPWINLSGNVPDINWSNALISWSSIHTNDPGTIGAMIAGAAANGQAMFSYEGPEVGSPKGDDCGFGLDAEAQQYKQALSSANTGWQCDDGWPNPYGPVASFWTHD